MNYQVLKTELLEPRYSAMTDKEAADDLGNKIISAKQAIPTYLIKQYLMVAGVWLGVKQSGTSTAITAMDALDNFDSFDVTNPVVLVTLTAILNGLVLEVTVPDFIEAHKTAILEMGDKLISRSSEMGLGAVTAGQVQAARNG